MKILLKLTQIFLILSFISACKTIKEKENSIINKSESESIEEFNQGTQTKEIKISCGKGDIAELLNDGWTILKESKLEKVCSWKSYPANKTCDMNKDKGCKITKPDKIGEERIYLLEKQLN